MKGSKGIASFFNSEAIQVVPRVLPNATYTMWDMVRLVMASRNGGPIIKGLLSMNFLGDFLWVGKDVIISVCETVQRGVIGVFKNLSVNCFGALVVE